ncbi:uncharacterized protein LOC133284295 [Gastrolobium bilobum]|uniref:uncharacterized protein LOC133284295 n=1 Tax=Gastrolobium bilobum TaxID=150636 RepID=UPI002AAF0CBD|nr:uncharacterized protein LOC133284295 [Gastrolobium bilobum]
MGQELELDLNDKSSVVGLSPNTVLPSHQYGFLKLREDLAENNFARFCNSSCKRLPCRSHVLEDNIEMRRGSLYQNSEEIIKKIGTMGGRKKIEISCRSSDASFSSSIVDSLCGSDDEDSDEVTSVISQNSNLSSPSVSGSWACMAHNTSNDFISFCMNSDVWDKKSSDVEGIGSINSFTKSKSLTSPVSCMLETTEVKLTGTRNRTYQKSLLNDFSNTAKHSDIISEFINRDIQYSGLTCSPVHLHGNLKLKYKQGLPFLEFKVKCPEDVFVAKTWRAGNAFNWVYTFHSIGNNRKKSNSAGLGSHDFEKDSSMVAQMLVSYHLSSELEGGIFDNSMVTEFVLYDLSHSRKSASPKIKSFVGVKGKETPSSNSYPWLSTELHSNLEIAAIVLQIPFHMRESLKYKRGDRVNSKTYSRLSDLSSAVKHGRKGLIDRKVMEQVKVVLPTGKHGLPNGESKGPSSLLDRWKHGGGCDCGGWDMACPLILLGNPNIQLAEDHPLLEEYQPLELFVEGAKESTPTLGLKIVEEGEYAVDFHAQLSPLQAFSICVAILHGTFPFNGVGQEKNQELSQCNSLKMLIEEEVELLIKSVTAEGKKTMSKIQKGIPRTYVLNPPFSPIARV